MDIWLRFNSDCDRAMQRMAGSSIIDLNILLSSTARCHKYDVHETRIKQDLFINCSHGAWRKNLTCQTSSLARGMIPTQR